jgi:anti-sigma-K factor RskA
VARLAHKTAPVAAPKEEPPIDPEAVERAYRIHRARRAAKAKRHRERRWAGVRFWFVLAVTLAVAAVLAARTLGEIERVFGL